jgi:hypothetical protein
LDFNRNTKRNGNLYKNKKVQKGIMPDLKYTGARDAVFILENMGLIPAC